MKCLNSARLLFGNSWVKQNALPDYATNRGVQQGAVEGPFEAGSVQSIIARDTRWAIHARQKDSDLPWANVENSDISGGAGAPKPATEPASFCASGPQRSRKTF